MDIEQHVIKVKRYDDTRFSSEAIMMIASMLVEMRADLEHAAERIHKASGWGGPITEEEIRQAAWELEVDKFIVGEKEDDGSGID